MAVSPENTSAPKAEENLAKAGTADLFFQKSGHPADAAAPPHAKSATAKAVEDEQENGGEPAEAEVQFRKSESRAQGAISLLKEKFNKENLFGSMFLLALTLNTLQGMWAGMNQQKVTEKNGVTVIRKDVDPTRVAVALATIGTNVWTFMSSRRGATPDGDSMPERMWDAIAHPNRSQVQARELIILPITALAVAGHLYYGAGLDRRKEFFPKGVPSSSKELFSQGGALLKTGVPMRLFQGGSALLTTWLALSSLFGKEAERKKAKEEARERAKGAGADGAPSSAADGAAKPQERTQAGQQTEGKEKAGAEPAFSKSKSKGIGGLLSYPVRMFKVTWQENPKLVISSALSFLSSVALFIEGTTKRNVMQGRMEKIKDFSTPEGADIRKTMLKTPKYHGLGEAELLKKLPDFKADQLKESHALTRMGIIGMTLNLCGQFYRASQLERESARSMSR